MSFAAPPSILQNGVIKDVTAPTAIAAGTLVANDFLPPGGVVGSISTTNLIITALYAGNQICVGEIVGGASAGTIVTALPSGATIGCATTTGTYTVNNSQTLASVTGIRGLVTMTANTAGPGVGVGDTITFTNDFTTWTVASGVTNADAAAGTSSLGFAGGVLTTAPPQGALVSDSNNPTAIPPGTTVIAGATTTVVGLSATIQAGASTGVKSGDLIVFRSAALPKTSSTTAAANAVLHFAAANVSGLVVGMPVADLTAAGVIPANTVIKSIAAGDITMNNAAAGAGVGSGDMFEFQTTLFPRTLSKASGYGNPSGNFSVSTELNPIVYAYQAAPYFWVTPDALVTADFLATGPGGPGASGAVQATGAACSGGAGGGAGGADFETMTIGALSGPETLVTITTGPASTGGTVVSSAGTSVGSQGTNSTANTTIAATGGANIAVGNKGGLGWGGGLAANSSGGGGGANATQGADATGATAPGAGGNIGGGGGGAGAVGSSGIALGAGSGGGGDANGAGGSNGGQGAWAPSGGAAGGGASAGNAFQTGGSGGLVARVSQATGGSTAGAIGADGTSITCGAGSVFGLNRCFGSGGGGGAGASGAGPIAGGHGGAGGAPGGGGGGGGCAQISSGTGTSGAGGNGAAGGAIIVPHFGP